MSSPSHPCRISARRAAQLIGIGVASFVLLALVFMPGIVGPDRSRTRLTICISNLKQTGLAFEMYLQDWDSRLPPTPGWNDRIVPYLKRADILRCPELKLTPGAIGGYAYNSAVAGTLRSASPDPVTALVYDSLRLRPDASDPVTTLPLPGRHNGRNVILHLDGRTRTVVDKANPAQSR